jgi:hypothetical protein
VNRNSKAARRRDIIAHYENKRNKALAKLEEEDSEDDWFVASPLANQKKEESEADRAVATDNRGPGADKRRGKKRKNDDY